jgi:hypothetical protein
MRGYEGIKVLPLTVELSDREATEMAREAICRVWYGKRFGIPQAFRDIGTFYGAARWATLVMADRIEVMREPVRPVAIIDRRAELKSRPD